MRISTRSTISLVLCLLYNSLLWGQTINTNLPVGTTAGNINVSASGGANYQIPIIIPLGTAGLAPQLSVNYSSQAGNGLMGKGWGLCGSSAITRVPQDLYHDGQVKEVQLNESDRFALDGIRLTVTKKDVNTEYHTESESFSRITSYGTSGSGPRWFKVETKDGKILEYGNSDNSILQPSSKDEAMFWYLSKITDPSGNYITYTYHSDRTKGEFWLEKVEYTGNANAGLVPYNSVNLTYQARPDTSTTYIAGCGIVQNVLLTGIAAVNEGTTVHEYEFKYSQNIFSQLNEVIEYGTNHTALNSTKINWSANSSENVSYKTSFNTSSTCLFDDFNGDGKKEFIKISDTPYLYGLKSDRTDFVSLGACNIQGMDSNSKSGDFNGDGKADVITLLSNNSNSFSYYKSNGNSFSLVGSYGPAVTTEPMVYPGDYDGGGIADVLVRNSSDNSLTIYWGNSSTPFATSSPAQTINWGTKQLFGDFDGNGKLDIMTLDGSGYKIYEWENGTFQLKQSNSSPTASNNIYIGDFNGDGKSDLFSYYSSGRTGTTTTIASTYISTGTGFVKYSQSLGPGFKPIHVADFNGDGADDILTDITAYRFQNNRLVTLDSGDYSISDFCGGENLFYDFDGDGLIDYLSDFNGDNMLYRMLKRTMD